jgi:AraC-like DNA-binding protein
MATISPDEVCDGAPPAIPGFALAAPPTAGGTALAAYCAAVEPVFRCTLPPGTAPAAFRCDVAAWHLGTLMIGRFAATALNFERDAMIAATSGMDHLLVQLYIAGDFTGFADDRPMRVGPDDICLFDMAGTLRTEASDFSNISMMVPRAYFAAAFRDVGALNGLVLRADAAQASLVADYLRALVMRLPQLGATEAEAAARAVITLLVTILQLQAPGTESVAHDRPPSLLLGITRHIGERLADPGLTTADLARHFNVSRATLYRLFEPLGGVSDYIRRRRLTGAAIELTGTAGSGKLADLAFRWGFDSEGSFSRAFKRRFGLTPASARMLSTRDRLATDVAGAIRPEERFSRWLRTL